MNCKQIDELLPLYAGRDLDDKRARLVAEHLQMCAACGRVAGEYRETIELTQHFVPPVFTDDAFANVRRQVLRQIENEPTASLLPQIFAGWFRPRIAWAVASGLIIAFGFFALYLIVKRPADVQPIADNRPTVIEHLQSATWPPKTPQSAGTPQKPGEKERRIIRNFVNRSPLVASKTRNSSAAAAASSTKLREPDAGNSLPAIDAVPGESPLRVEMQTKDPNIRIIWFSQTNSKPALPNAKGI